MDKNMLTRLLDGVENMSPWLLFAVVVGVMALAMAGLVFASVGQINIPRIPACVHQR
jgi:hypothetical protein